MGHKTPKRTTRYVQVAPADMREAYDQALTGIDEHGRSGAAFLRETSECPA